MRIKSKGGGPRKMHVRAYMPAGYMVEFDDKGIAEVSKEVGEALCAAYDGITPVASRKKAKKEADE